MKIYNKSFIAITSALALTACGGGDGDVGDVGGGGAPDPSTYVSGNFFDARQTGDAYLDDPKGLGTFGDKCVGQDHYFEAANGRVRVYGTPSFSETTYSMMATYIDNNIEPVMTQFNTTWDEFVARRQLLTLKSMKILLGFYLNEDGSVKAPLENDYDFFSFTSEPESYASWMAMTDEQRLQTLDDVVVMLNQSYQDSVYTDYLPDMLERDYVVACLNQNMSGSMSGEGTFHGVALTDNPDIYNGDFGKLVKRGLVNFVQENMTRVADSTTGGSLPPWFAEGQAIVYAGMSYHNFSDHYNYEPLEVVSTSGETVDSSETYKHYGLAFNYLEKANGKAAIADMLWAIGDDTTDPVNPWPATNQKAPQFIQAFDANMVDHEGNPLSFSRFTNDYHTLMETQY